MTATDDAREVLAGVDLVSGPFAMVDVEVLFRLARTLLALTGEQAVEAAARAAAQLINDEGGRPGNSVHSWRCEYPDRYGHCTCVEELAVDVARDVLAAALAAAEEAR